MDTEPDMMLRRIGNGLRTRAAGQLFNPVLGKIVPSILGEGFSSRSDRRMVIYYHPNAICWASIYPYFYYADKFSQEYGIDIRAVPVERFLAGSDIREADILMVQPWFTEDPGRIGDSLGHYRNAFPGSKIYFIDSYAHTDLRLGRHVSNHVDGYLRKALFRNRQAFLRPRLGDTNLTEYYMQLYGLEGGATVDWQVPETMLGKLGLIPNFLTAPHIIPVFSAEAPNFLKRPIDLNVRITAKGTPWYNAMRQHAISAARNIEGITLSPEERVSRSQFLAELRHSKLCWSPFGYGELCWRDIEAFMTGAVLIKPDMSHLETQPDLYRPGETYLSVRWDFSNLEEVTRAALADPDRLQKIASTAFHNCRNYLKNQYFVTDTANILQ